MSFSRGIWVAAVNHRDARLFRAETETAPIVHVETIHNPDADASESELHHHAAGRTMNRTTGRSTQMQSRTEGRKGVDEAFARSIAERLDVLRTSGALTRLHLVADPGMLGLLRPALSKESSRLIVNEVVRDPAHDNEAGLRAVLPRAL